MWSDAREVSAPAPSRWNRDDMNPGMDISSDGLELRYLAPAPARPEREHDACAVRADRPMPPERGICYFEVTILAGKAEDAPNTTIGIGFSSKKVSLSRMPGWESESWGYHGDDGRVYVGSNVGKQFGTRFGVGDVIGCGINFRRGQAFFTKNGAFINIASQDVRAEVPLYPSVGLKRTGEAIRANFGECPFVFSLDRFFNKERAHIRKDIDSASTSHLAPPLNETELIQTLVLQFLQHDGYVDTARALAEEIREQKKSLTLDPNQVIEGVNIKDDEDANNRQRIRKAIRDGDIDRALKLTNAYYRGVLEANPAVYFRLRCRKFIEMVLDATIMRDEIHYLDTGADGSRSASSNGFDPNQEMDLDGSVVWDRMDTDKDGATAGPGDVSKLRGQLEILEEETLEYGQKLGAEFGDDTHPDVKQTLGQMFSLLAYDQPQSKPEYSEMLSPKGRDAVAEELNAAILTSLGKSSRSALETVWAQTSVLLDDLKEKGGPGAFVGLEDVMEQVRDTHY